MGKESTNLRLRIGFFTDSYLPYFSGVVNSIQSFKKQLEKLGHQIYIFSPSYYNHSKTEADVFRFISLPAPTHKNFNLALPFSLNIIKKARSLKLDLIHAHSPFMMGYLGLVAARRCNIPFVFTYHTFYHYYLHYLPLPANLTLSCLRFWEKRFCNSCHLVLAPSQAVKSHLENINVLAPVKILPTGVELADFCQQESVDFFQRKYNIPKGVNILLSVSRLSKEKNVEFLLKAFSRLPPDLAQKTYLFIVGDGPEKERLEKQKDLMSYGSHIFFPGAAARDELVKHYINADLFIFSSPSETQGLVIAEAKAAGLPVLALEASGVSEAIRDGKDGFLVKPAEEENFLEKLVMLLKNYNLRKELSCEAVKQSVFFSAQQRAQELQNYYLEVLQENSFKAVSL